MKSRVQPKYKTKYRVGDWPAYEQALVRRVDITLWLSADAIAAWTPAPTGRRGGQRKFSDHAIETALTLRLVFGLLLRQAEGFLRSVLSLMNVDREAPDHTTLSRRSQHLDVRFHLLLTPDFLCPTRMSPLEHRHILSGAGPVLRRDVAESRGVGASRRGFDPSGARGFSGVVGRSWHTILS